MPYARGPVALRLGITDIQPGESVSARCDMPCGHRLGVVGNYVHARPDLLRTTQQAVGRKRARGLSWEPAVNDDPARRGTSEPVRAHLGTGAKRAVAGAGENETSQSQDITCTRRADSRWELFVGMPSVGWESSHGSEGLSPHLLELCKLDIGRLEVLKKVGVRP